MVQTITQPRGGRRPDIVGHFNLITKRNADHKLIDETDPAYKAIAFEALRACTETGAIFEINNEFDKFNDFGVYEKFLKGE